MAKPNHYNTTNLTQANVWVWDEHACIEGCRKEDLLSQELLYRKFYGVMMALVFRYTNDKDEAATILNNGFLRVFKKIDLYSGQGSLEGWIRKIMVHQVADFFRSKKKIEFKEIDKIENTLENAEQIELKHDYAILLQALQQLNSTCRLVLNLFVIEGYTYPQIKELTGINENTSKWHVATGKKQLAHYLKSLKP